ncbi:MAG: CPBP family intramembrane metalloprotease [Candidatus Hydrogenedentes bacterium]|nr:CPBP family intramembrane metalloprotease [Candidatus Hydrogenedentota bacterium]
METSVKVPPAVEETPGSARIRWWPFRGKPFPTYLEAVLMTVSIMCGQALVAVVAAIWLAVALAVSEDHSVSIGGKTVVVLFGASLAFMVPPILWGLWRAGHPAREALGLRRAPAAAFLGTITLSIGLNVCLSEMDNLIRTTCPLPNLVEDYMGIALGAPVGMFVTVCVMAPVLEESLFRGLILNGLLKRRGPRKAILVTALLFAIGHVNPAQVLFAFLLGVVFGWLFLRTHSVWVAILAHFTHNCMAALSPLFAPGIPGATTEPEPGVFQPLWLDLLGLALLMAGMVIFAAATSSRTAEHAPADTREEACGDSR